jgi:hypothetical protein
MFFHCDGCFLDVNNNLCMFSWFFSLKMKKHVFFTLIDVSWMSITIYVCFHGVSHFDGCFLGCQQQLLGVSWMSTTIYACFYGFSHWEWKTWFFLLWWLFSWMSTTIDGYRHLVIVWWFCVLMNLFVVFLDVNISSTTTWMQTSSYCLMVMCVGQFICCFHGCQHKSNNNLDVNNNCCCFLGFQHKFTTTIAGCLLDVNIRLEYYDSKVTSSDKEISIMEYSYPRVENTDRKR